MTSGSDSEVIGDVGESAVKTMLLRFRWNVWATNNRDRGTDLIVLTKEVDRPIAFGVQVRSGQSRFASRKHDSDGDLLGWWHSDTRRRFDYWTNHTLPHILVLYNDEEGVGYWVHVTADNVHSTGKGRKIFVPADQTIDESHRAGILAVAQVQSHSPKLEGTAFWAAAENIAPEHQLRYALLEPRLVAPHVNTGHGNPISPVEAVALLAQGRFSDLAEFAKLHPSVHDPKKEPPEGSGWAWSLVVAIWNWATTDRVDQLGDVFDSAPEGKDKVASGMLLACALQRFIVHGDGRKARKARAEATALLDGLKEIGDLAPTDLGWVLIQRARFNRDAGRDEFALIDARAALEMLTDGADVTATALAAAATATVWSIVAIQDFEEADLGGLMTAADNAVSWWRSQVISGALTSAARTHFDAWTEKRHLFFVSSNVSDNKLFAAELNADLLGELGTYRHIASLKARQRMMSADSSHNEVTELTEGLNALRRSGDEASLKSAIVHLRRAGPIEAVTRSVNEISTDGWTLTTAPANYAALSLAGDLMDEAMATELLHWIARNVCGEGTEDDERLLNAVLVETSVLGAMAGLMRSADSSAHRAVVTMVGTLSEPHLDHPVNRLPNVIRQLEFDQLPAAERNVLSKIAWGDRGRTGVAALGCFAANDDLAAIGELTSRAVQGDLTTLDAIPLAALNDVDADPIIACLEGLVQATLLSARNGSRSIGGPDNCGALAQLNIRFPTVARWDAIVELLCEPLVLESDKRSPWSHIIESASLLPEYARNRLLEYPDSIGNCVQASGRTYDSGMGVAISIAFDAITGPDADKAMAELACGSPQHRQNAALVLGAGHMPNMQPVLLGLAGDAEFEVRYEAAEAVGKLVAANPRPEIVELARQIAADRGTDLPELLLIGLARQNNEVSGDSASLAQMLVENPSARVRHRAQCLLSRHAGKQGTTS